MRLLAGLVHFCHFPLAQFGYGSCRGILSLAALVATFWFSYVVILSHAIPLNSPAVWDACPEFVSLIATGNMEGWDHDNCCKPFRAARRELFIKSRLLD